MCMYYCKMCYFLTEMARPPSCSELPVTSNELSSIYRSTISLQVQRCPVHQRLVIPPGVEISRSPTYFPHTFSEPFYQETVPRPPHGLLPPPYHEIAGHHRTNIQSRLYHPMHLPSTPSYLSLRYQSADLIRAHLQPTLHHQTPVSMVHITPQQPPPSPPFYHHNRPIFPFSSPGSLPRPILQPPQLQKDYTLHCNLPAPPRSLIFESCKHLPKWWTDPEESLDITQSLVRDETSQSKMKPPELIEIFQHEDPSFPEHYDLFSLLEDEPGFFDLPLSSEKPPYSYSALAAIAIMSTPHKMATLSEIYSFISTTFPFYEKSKRAWKNAIRNTLCTSECFKEAPFAPPEDKSGKGIYWILDPFSKTSFLKGSFQTQKQQRPKCARKKKGNSTTALSVDSLLLMYATDTIPNTNTNIVELIPTIPRTQEKVVHFIKQPSQFTLERFQ